MAIQETQKLPIEHLSLLGSEIRTHQFIGEEGPEDYLVITRGAADSLYWSLAQKIRENGFKPDIVIVITRGGLSPGRPLADYLGDLQMVTIGIASGYGPDRQRLPPVITQPLPDLDKLEGSLRMVGKLKPEQKITKVLVVDEIVDRGDTPHEAMEHIKEKWKITQASGNLKFACLVAKAKGLENSTVDFHVLETSAWVVFPWEICETIKGLYNRWKAYKNPLPDSEIKDRLKELGFSESDISEFWPKN